MLEKLLQRVKPQNNPADMTYRLIHVEATNLRAISLHAINEIKKPLVMLDSVTIKDFTERGPLRRKRIAEAGDFEIRDGDHPVLGFHGGQHKMWFSDRYTQVAKYCESQGWLKIKNSATA